MPAPDDQSLVDRWRQGEAEAFEELVRRHQDAVYRFVVRNAGDPSAAEDLAQEVFIRAYQSLKRFRGASSFRTWLFRIARNLCIDHQRRTKVLRRKTADWQESSDVGQADPLDEGATGQELHLEVERALRQLPPPLRRVVVMYDLEGMSYQEIREVEGCPLGTVKSRLFAARRTLRRLLTPYVERGEPTRCQSGDSNAVPEN